jgi:hypothetical protein
MTGNILVDIPGGVIFVFHDSFLEDNPIDPNAEVNFGIGDDPMPWSARSSLSE